MQPAKASPRAGIGLQTLTHHWIFIPSRVEQSGVVLSAGLLVMAFVARKLLRSLQSMVSVDALPRRGSTSALGVLLHLIFVIQDSCLSFNPIKSTALFQFQPFVLG